MAPVPSTDVARPPRRHRSWFAALFVALSLMAFAADPADAQSVVDSDLDSDGDGIVNAFDPDDDNDGIMDDRDPAPFNPSIPGGPLPPSSIDPDADSDGDGIANSHDPDDDNDGATDIDDPVVFDPDNTLPSSGGSGGGAGSGSNGAVSTDGSARAGSGSRAVVVTGLPRTGAGPHTGTSHGFPHLLLTATGILLMLATASITRQALAVRRAPVRRQWSPVRRR